MASDFKIDALDSGTAVNILKRLATADPDYAEASKEVAMFSLPPLSPSQQAELAKQTLLVLSEDLRRAQAIAILAREPGHAASISASPARPFWFVSLPYCARISSTTEIRMAHQNSKSFTNR